MMGEVSEHGAIFHPQGVWAQRGDGGVPSGPDGKESVCNTGDTGPIPGILQARTLEWVAISSSNA